MILHHYMSPAEVAQESLRAAILGIEHDWYAIEAHLRFELFSQQRASDDGMPEHAT